MKFLLIFQVFLYSFFISQASEVLNLGELTRSENIRPINLCIESSNPELLSITQKAFQLHGGFKLTSLGSEDFLVKIVQNDSNSITLSILSGAHKVTQYEESFTGPTLRDATLKACNKIVEKTLGIPGFFTGKLTFVGNRNHTSRELYVADILFNDVHQITKDSVDIVSPKFSPNGDFIVYTSYYKTGFPDIFMVNIPSGQRKTIAGYEGTNTGACFNPQGNKLAMILTSKGNAELFVSDISGKNLKKITSTPALEATPTWSNDGKYIYFSSDPMGSPQLYKIASTGGALQRIPTNISKYCAEPALNPLDNNIIAFTAAVSGKFQLAIYDDVKKESRFLSIPDADFMEPCWLNDGRHLIATKRIGNDTQLYVIDTITNKSVPLHQKAFGNSMMANFINKIR